MVTPVEAMARCADCGDLGATIPFGRPTSIRGPRQHPGAHRQRDQRAWGGDEKAGRSHPSALVTKQWMNGLANVARPDPRQLHTSPRRPRMPPVALRSMPGSGPSRQPLGARRIKQPPSIGSRIAKPEKSAILWVLISKLNKPDRGCAAISVAVAGWSRRRPLALRV